MIVSGELKGGSEEDNNIDLELNWQNLINSQSYPTGWPSNSRTIFQLNDLDSGESVYQFTFTDQVAGCSKGFEKLILCRATR